MPASPAMTPTCRVPWRAVVHHCASWASAASRPTKCGGRLKSGGGERCEVPMTSGLRGDAGALTGAMNRYPRPCTVAINRGVRVASPNTRRSCRMATVITDSLTTVSGQTAASRASLVTSWPACRHQTAQHRKRFRVQMDHLMAVPQPFVVEIKVKLVKDEAMRDLHTFVGSCAPAAPGQRRRYYGHLQHVPCAVSSRKSVDYTLYSCGGRLSELF